MSLPHERIELAETADLARVQSFYLSVGYGGGIHPSDRLLVSSADKLIVAVVRLCTECGTLVLRGMYVAEDRRGLGIGSRLLESTSAIIGSSECWCIPYAHLTNFYSRIGFPATRFCRFSRCGIGFPPSFTGFSAANSIPDYVFWLYFENSNVSLGIELSISKNFDGLARSWHEEA